jgi:hypothetical protein
MFRPHAAASETELDGRDCGDYEDCCVEPKLHEPTLYGKTAGKPCVYHASPWGAGLITKNWALQADRS